MRWLKGRDLLRNMALVQGATGISFLFAYLFHIYMGRALGPAAYGILGSLLSILYMVSVPLDTIQAAITKPVAELGVQKDYGKIASLMRQALTRVNLGGIGVAALLLVTVPFGTHYLNLPSPWPLALMIGILPALCFVSVLRGMLRGLLNFNHLALNLALEKPLVLLSGVALVSLGMGASGAVLSYGVGTLLTALVALMPLRFLLRRGDGSYRFHMLDYSKPVFFTLMLVAVMVSVDLVIARHYLTPEESGYYTAASMTGKVLFFSAMAIAVVLFPTTCRLYAEGKSGLPVLKGSLLFLGVLAGFLLLLTFFFPSPLLRWLFGTAFVQGASYLAPYVLAMSLLSFSVLLMYYNLAMERTQFNYLLLFCTLMEIGLLLLFHSTALRIIWSLVASFASLAAFNLLYTFLHQPGLRPRPLREGSSQAD